MPHMHVRWTARVTNSPQLEGLLSSLRRGYQRRGIVTLPAGSRVIDALQAAGGSRKGTDLAGLNLARPLADGEQILVGAGVPAAPSVGGTPGAPTADGSAAGGGALVNLNTATSAELDSMKNGSIRPWLPQRRGVHAPGTRPPQVVCA